MNKKYYRLIGTICAICGVVGGVIMIVAAFMEDVFPRPLWIVAAICMFLNVIGLIVNNRYIHSQEIKADTSEKNKEDSK